MAKRRTFTAEFKARVVLKVISGMKSAAEVCREHSIKPQLLSGWKSAFLENAPMIFKPDGQRSEPSSHPRTGVLTGPEEHGVGDRKKTSNILTAH